MDISTEAIELVGFVVERLVDKREDVKIDCVESEEGTWLVKLEVAPQDLGLIIGKGGKTAMALRSLLRVFALKNEIWLRLQIVGEDKPPQSKSS